MTLIVTKAGESKEVIHMKIHPCIISGVSGIEISEAYHQIPTNKKQSKRALRQQPAERTHSHNALVTTVENKTNHGRTHIFIR